MKKEFIVVVIFVLLFSVGITARSLDYNSSVNDVNLHKKNNGEEQLKDSQELKQETSEPIKGIYLTGWVAGSPKRFNRLLNLITETELNAMVIDVKNIEGEVSYNSKVDLTEEIGANVAKIKNIDRLLDKCKENNIYSIARIPVFKDYKLAAYKEYALKYYDLQQSNSEIFSSPEWVNPYSKKVWKYNVDLAIEAVKHGFDEVQFDYIRFPVFFNRSRYNLAVAPSNSKVRIIDDFLRYAKNRLDKLEAPVSIDVFGLTTTGNDLGIGQNFALMAQRIDYISPMVYPSHYQPGIYGLTLPEQTPYSTVFNSMQEAKEKLNGETGQIRPWLQDFSLRYKYGVEEVREQIAAAKASGLDSWLLWNPASNYTWQAFLDNEIVINKKKRLIDIIDDIEGDNDVRVNRRESNAQENESRERPFDRT
ncbi:putative glycoside hydrolase [Acetohalobium arabaticum]|uniref:DUF4015 domain-containing protein n=1 Tax=Acetohalobium arabaticum (strain ATCC 49924 / DSM 5501 / Z-7288) TaxID=574087 RepID=D9QSY8_ACEAZ|nr:putative glycoside hydrolase [Acetohalobium arabaticum]ADL11676.1 conserved hypothetical protein [Acetohalobium arabaticum DSM 5501]